ncbi:PHP domain-containing protein, partial [Dolichospermum sp. ST_sed4]|nr:PHP domain-containing protein [Dolichospermum sp. ST_sed4]
RTAKELGQTAIALTNHGYLSSMLDGRTASKKYGVKYLVGLEAYFVQDAKSEEKQKRHHLVLICKNELGFRNLLQLNYYGFVNSRYVSLANKTFPQIDWTLLEQYHEGLICLTACPSG